MALVCAKRVEPLCFSLIKILFVSLKIKQNRRLTKRKTKKLIQGEFKEYTNAYLEKKRKILT